MIMKIALGLLLILTSVGSALADSTLDVIAKTQAEIEGINARISAEQATSERSRAALAARGNEIIALKTRHDALQRQYTNDSTAYNANCAGRPLSYGNCPSWRVKVLAEQQQWAPALANMEQRANELMRQSQQLSNDLALSNVRVQKLMNDKSQLEANVEHLKASLNQTPHGPPLQTQNQAADKIVPNLANDPNAARLSAAELRLVDGRISNLRKAIALLCESNPEWALERERLLEDTHEDAVDFSLEFVNLLSLGFAEASKAVTASHMDAAEMDALFKAFKEPLTDLSAEEARISRIMGATQNPKLAGAIRKYLDALHRYREAVDTHDVVELTARARDSVEALKDEFEVLKVVTPPTSKVADGLYVSSVMVGRIAMIFAEGPTATIVAAGSAGASFLVGGR
jgi:hypothetical protein